MAVEAPASTKRRLLEAAARVFAERGYAGATVREICAAAGANNAAVNYHFGDKRRLYVETLKEMSGARSAADEVPDWPAGTPAAVKLRGFVEALLRKMLDTSGSAAGNQLLMRELASPSEGTVELVRAFIRRDFDLLVSIIAELAPAASAEERHLIAFSVVGQCGHYRFARAPTALLVGPDEFATYTIDALADHICRFSLAALGVPS